MPRLRHLSGAPALVARRSAAPEGRRRSQSAPRATDPKLREGIRAELLTTAARALPQAEVSCAWLDPRRSAHLGPLVAGRAVLGAWEPIGAALCDPHRSHVRELPLRS